MSFLFFAVTCLLAGLWPSAHAVPSSSTGVTDAAALIEASLEALGGRAALANLQGVTYESENFFRARTLSQNYLLLATDRYTISGGSQNVSFGFRDEDEYLYRLDRTYVLSDYYTFRRREISPRDFSLVEKSGPDGFACMVKGNYAIFLEANDTFGYFDGPMTDYLLFESLKYSPKLLLQVEKHSPAKTTVSFRQVDYPGVHDETLGITIAFDPETDLPLFIRSTHNHPIRGQYSNDLQLFEYVEQDGLKFPTEVKTVSNGTAIIEETVVTRITINPTYQDGYFEGLGPDETETQPSPPQKAADYPPALLSEYWSNALWVDLYQGSVEEIDVSIPADDLPGAYRLFFPRNSNYVQMVLEFEDSVIVFESPHHQSDLVIRWVADTLKKPISHLWVSHHHHDHNLDVAKFVELGASVIVPEIAASYWSLIPGIKLVTIAENKPYIHSDSKMQARFLWRPDHPHSSDWTYAMITAACPDTNSSTIAYCADSFSTGVLYDSNASGAWVDRATDDGLSKETIVIPTHGEKSSWADVLKPLGVDYPDFDSTSFKTGGNICLSS